MKTEKTKLPIYNETKHSELKPGLYLGLFHGRRRADEDLKDWGSNGPIIGPLEWCHTTYGDHIRIRLRKDADRKAHAALLKNDHEEPDFFLKDGLLKVGRVYYGDWTVFEVEASPLRNDTLALIDYIIENEEEDFHEQLTNDIIVPLDTTEKGRKAWVKLRDKWDDAKRHDAEAEFEDELALIGRGHIYCSAMQLRKKLLTE